MKKIQLSMLIMLFAVMAKAQLTGVKQIPGDYATLALAITDLNTQGVGAGGVVINLNQTETAPSGGYLIGSATLNASAIATNPVTINGKLNTITGFTGISTTADAVIRVAGTDNVTLDSIKIDGIGTTALNQMERGIWAAIFSQNDAPQNLTIKNCDINLGGTIANNAEVGILVNSDIYTSTAAYTTVFATAPTNATGAITNVVIQSNIINNCFIGVVVKGATVSATYHAQNITVGGNSLVEGNTITNVAIGATGTAYGIHLINANDINVNYNTISTNLTGTVAATLSGINIGVGIGFKNINYNNISLSNSLAASSSPLYGINHSSTVGSPTDININYNNIHDFVHAGSGLLYYITNTCNPSVTNNINNNTLVNLNRTGASGSSWAIFSSASLATGLRQINNNTITNFSHSINSGATSSLMNIINATGTQSAEIKGNIISAVSMNGTSTAAQTLNGINCGITTSNVLIDSNRLSGINIASAVGSMFGINGANATANVIISRNNISGMIKTLTGTGNMFIEGITVSGASTSRSIVNNFISDLVNAGGHLDNMIKGISVVGGSLNGVYHNTIYLGSAAPLTSSGTNFGVSGISFGSGAGVDVRNNIVNVKATPNGNGLVCALRSADAGTAGTIPSGYAATSNNNIYYVPNALNSYYYAEATVGGVPVNGYNSTNDPVFNTGCSAFKVFASGREGSSFSEDNLSPITATTFAPTGASFAESGGQAITGISVDYNNVVRGTPSDMGALEFSGTVTDAAPPAISYTAPYYTTYCTNLPTLQATITDVSGVNTSAGTKPRLYFKKTSNTDTYVGNTSADNGWKYVEASNSTSPFSLTFDPTLLTAPPAIGDTIQYFIVAQDLATIPNVGTNNVALASGFCPTTVALTGSAFPTQSSIVINYMELINFSAITMVTTADPSNACLNGFTSLSVSDTISVPGLMPTGYNNPLLQVTGANNDDIRRVQITTTSLNNSTACGAAGGGAVNGLLGSVTGRYSNFTGTVAPVTLTNGTAYSGQVDVNNCNGGTGSSGYAIYIDLNRNGTFEATEKVFNSGATLVSVPTAVTTYNFNFTIPATGVSDGPSLMRIVLLQNVTGSAITTASSNASGEIEDYKVILNTNNVKVVNSLATNAFVWTPSANIATNPNRTVTASNISANTIYTVTATDGGGCTATSTKEVTIATPVIATGVTGTISYCNYSGANTVVTVTTANGSTPITAVWTGGPVSSTSGLSATVNPPLGQTTYTVTVTDACGTSATTSVVITVNPVPTVSVSPGTGPACSGQTSNQTATGVGSNLTYTWNPGALTGPSQSLAPISTTTYTVTVTEGTCSSTSTFVLTPSTSPNVTAISANPTLACVGDSIQISTTATAGVTYSWSPNTNISNPSIGNPKVAPFAPTIYTVTVSTAVGCTKTANVLANVHPLISGSFSATPAIICEGLSSDLNANVPTQCGGTTTGFQQAYAPANWTLSQTNSNGIVVTSGAPNSIQLKSGTNASGNTGSTNYAITVGCSGTIAFNWSYTTPDAAYNDYPRYRINSNTPVILPGFDNSGNGSSVQTGSFSIPVSAGDVFTLQMYTEDNDPFQATTTFTTFSGPAAPVGGTASFWSAKTGGTLLGSPVLPVSPTTTTKYYIQYTQTGTGCINPFRDSVTVTVNPKPILTVATLPNDTVCTNSPVTLQGSGAVSYLWNGTPTATGDTILTPATAGIYTVTGTDGNGCSNTATQEIWLHALPVITASVSPNDTVCAGTTVTLQGGGANSYSWNGNPVSGADSVLSPAVAGNYTVVGTDVNGCTGSATQELVVNTVVLTVSASPNDSVCSGDPVTLQASGALTYTWNGIPTTTGDTTLTPAVGGNYSVIGTDALGCSNIGSILITVNSLPVVTGSASNPAPCQNSSIILTGAGANTYTWTGGVTDGQPFVPSITNYTVTGTDVNGCSSNSAVSITINPANSVLSNATASNASSTPGSSTGTDTQVPNAMLNYYSGNCNLIAGIMTINNLGSVTAKDSVESAVLTHNGQPFVPRWFEITPTNNSQADVTFYLTQDDFDDYNVYATANGWPLLPANPTDAAGISNLRVTKNDNSGLGNNPIVIAPNSVTWNATNSYWEVVVTVPSFSQFRFHSVNGVNAPLPVVITEFTGEIKEQGDFLQWTTSSEKSAAYFNIWYSNDGQHFEAIAKENTKAEQGNSNHLIHYNFINSQFSLGHNYYKLEQVDLDGKTNMHTKVIDLVRTAGGNVISLYPNPATDLVTMELYTPKAQLCEIKIADMSGRVVQQISYPTESGNNTIKINIGSMASGIYTVYTTINGKDMVVQKLTKK